MKTTKLAIRLLTAALCLAICLGLCMTGLAAGTITGVTIGLDTDNLTASSSAQTVTATIDLTLSGGDTVAARGANYQLSLPADWTLESYTMPEAASLKSASATAGMWALMSGSTEVSSLATLVIGIPADTPAGAYTIAVSSVKVSDASKTTLLENGAASATVTIADPAPVPEAWIYGHSLTLEGRIGVNTYMGFQSDGDILQDPENYQVEYWYGEELASATKVSDATTRSVDGQTLYGFTVTAAAKEMNREFTLKLLNISSGEYVPFTYMEGGEQKSGTSFDYAIADYLEEAKNEADKPKLADLAEAMDVYGGFAQHYFSVRDSSPDAAPEGSYSPVEAAVLEPYAIHAPDDLSDIFEYRGTSLVLEDQTTLRMYFQSTDTEALTLKLGEEDLEIRSGRGMYYVQIDNIAAKDLAISYTISISGGGNSTAATVSPLGYAHLAVQAEGKAALKYLASALYQYYISAAEYFNS